MRIALRRPGRPGGGAAGPPRLLVALALLGTVLIAAATGALSSTAAPLAQEDIPRPSGGAYWYSRYCPGCHGQRAEGTIIGPALTGRPDSPLSAEHILSRVRSPILLMPDFPANVIPDEKVIAIAEYIQSLEPAR